MFAPFSKGGEGIFWKFEFEYCLLLCIGAWNFLNSVC
jgi:hypothetical protein